MQEQEFAEIYQRENSGAAATTIFRVVKKQSGNMVAAKKATVKLTHATSKGQVGATAVDYGQPLRDCDGNIKRDTDQTSPTYGDPIRRPFVLDLAIDGGAGGCCTTTEMITGLIPGTYNNIGLFPQTQSRIIITEA